MLLPPPGPASDGIFKAGGYEIITVGAEADLRAADARADAAAS